MSTISPNLAERLVAAGGAIDGDPPAYAVFRYRGPYGEHHGVVWDERAFMRYVSEVEILEILWSPHVTLDEVGGVSVLLVGIDP